MKNILALNISQLTIFDIQTLSGINDEFLQLLEDEFDVMITIKVGELIITINNINTDLTPITNTIKNMIALVNKQASLTKDEVYNLIRLAKSDLAIYDKLQQSVLGKLGNGKSVTPKSKNQLHYVNSLQKYDVVFAVGPAGCGKTFLAVVHAVTLLKNNVINKIILTRPAVEAGENLGFLPGDLKEKIDPYLRPLYDALYDMLSKETVERMIEKGIIEIAPLAYMRGRTLDEAVIILDEAQNTTSNQMKMFLTRLGVNSKMIITGDISQIDIRNKSDSGLINALHILKDIKEISFNFLNASDVIRHPIVQKIIEAYDFKSEG